MLNSISKPPGSAPPFIPFKPVPRLVPLPSKHTLPVQQPNRFKLANFGELREDNLQMVLLARRITQQLVDVRQAFPPPPPPPPLQPRSLPREQMSLSTMSGTPPPLNLLPLSKPPSLQNSSLYTRRLVILKDHLCNCHLHVGCPLSSDHTPALTQGAASQRPCEVGCSGRDGAYHGAYQTCGFVPALICFGHVVVAI